jgi:nucleotidyltransferase/DNA polymerase involved in DNA repair
MQDRKAVEKKVILHVDMDAFFAAVEQRDHPEWRGKPVIVGAGPHERGVVSTCSYEARKFGVHSAMPSRTAYSLCPQGIFVKPRMKAYSAVSAQVFEILEHYSPFVEGVSVDEAFLDVTGTVHLFGDPRTLGERLRTEVRDKCRLTCSVGLAPNRLLAKIGSEEAKPDGLYVMPFADEEVRAWLAPRPVKILWGVGKKTNEILAKYGYRTCGDLQSADPRFLQRILGDAAAESIRRHANGIDFSEVVCEEEEKSVSREHTFPEDETDRAAVRETLLRLVGEVGRRMRRETRWARTGKLKLRDGAFNTITRQARFELPARDDMTFRHLALELFDREWPEGGRRTVRLVGFGVTDFTETRADPEPSLFPSPLAAAMEKRERLAEVLDRLQRK